MTMAEHAGISSKIIVFGDVQGNVKTLLKKVTSLNEKNGPFEMVLCAGEFFGEASSADWDLCLSEQVKCPVPIFLLGPHSKRTEKFYADVKSGGDFCPNITFLGECGVYQTASGLSIGFMSHSVDSVATVDKFLSPLVDQKDFLGIDILLTGKWPKGVMNFATPSRKVDVKSWCPLTARVARLTKPRYHFVGGEGIHLERQPYRNHRVLAENSSHVTRFIALGRFGNKDKVKSMYAFSAVPLTKVEKAELVKQPDDVTECPYQEEKLIGENSTEEESVQFFYNMPEGKTSGGQKRDNGRDGQADRPHKIAKWRQVTRDDCWFCLGSAKVEKHLVVNVADECYLALPKGGLHPLHALLCPIGHHQASVDLGDQSLMEVKKYKKALRKLYKKQGLVPFIFERNYMSAHCQIQVVPIPVARQSDAKEAMERVAGEYSLHLEEIPEHTDLRQVVQHNIPYFYAELHTGERFFSRIQKEQGKFPLQLGREIACDPALLNTTDKIDWRQCSLSREQETEVTREFRTLFEPYDFSS